MTESTKLLLLTIYMVLLGVVLYILPIAKPFFELYVALTSVYLVDKFLILTR